MKLYTKSGCVPCQQVKDYLKSRPNLEIEVIDCSQHPEKVMEFAKFSQSFPTLVTDFGFVNKGENIINYLTAIADNKILENNPLQTFDNQISEPAKTQTMTAQGLMAPKIHKIAEPALYREQEPECTSCQ